MFIKTKKTLKQKGNKQGSMLLIVCLIIAMALIFIASAMTVTSAARNRYYDNSKRSQARLTVTSVAEAFYDALQIQQISDDDLATLASHNATMKVTGGTLPGVVGANCSTTAKFYESGNYTMVDFTTNMDGTVERLRLILQGKPQPHAANLNMFPIELGAAGKLSEFTTIGGGGYGNPNNFVFIYGGNPSASSGAATFYSTVFTEAPLATEGNKYSDVVFWGPNATWYTPGSNGSLFNGIGENGTVDVFYLDTSNMISQSFSGSYSSSIANVVYSDGVTNNLLNSGLHTEDITFIAEDDVEGDLADALSIYRDVIDKVPDHFYTGAEAKAIVQASGVSTDGSSATAIGSQTVLTAGDYKISGTLSRRIICDCQDGAINIYVTGDLTFADGGYFDIVNGYEETGEFGNKVNIILADGKQITINKANSGSVSGIFATPRSRTVGADGYPVAASGASLPSGVADGAVNSNTVCPSCYIYGFSSNKITINGGSTNCVLDAYINLYGGGTVVFKADAYPSFYGRITCDQIDRTSGNITIPFCPAPPKTNKGAGTGDVEIHSNYEAVQYVYYYENGDV